MSIASCRFSMQRLNSESHVFHADFLDKCDTKVSDVSHVFKTDPYNLTVTRDQRTIDLLSQNGISSENPLDLLSNKSGHLFEHGDVKDLNRACAKFFKESKPGSTTLMVLDLQDPNRKYLDKQSIQENENAVVKLFSTKKKDLQATFPDLGKSASKVHSIFQDKMPLSSVLCEGSVKAKLIDLLTEDQAGFFLQHNRNSRSLFCQFTEPFLVAAKTGAQSYSSEIILSDHVKPISCHDGIAGDTSEACKVQETWYQGPYREMYGPGAAIPQQLQAVYEVSFENDTTHDITSMILQSPIRRPNA